MPAVMEKSADVDNRTGVREFDVIVHRDTESDWAFWAEFPQIPGASTCADTLDEMELYADEIIRLEVGEGTAFDVKMRFAS